MYNNVKTEEELSVDLIFNIFVQAFCQYSRHYLECFMAFFSLEIALWCVKCSYYLISGFKLLYKA